MGMQCRLLQLLLMSAVWLGCSVRSINELLTLASSHVHCTAGCAGHGQPGGGPEEHPGGPDRDSQVAWQACVHPPPVRGGDSGLRMHARVHACCWVLGEDETGITMRALHAWSEDGNASQHSALGLCMAIAAPPCHAICPALAAAELPPTSQPPTTLTSASCATPSPTQRAPRTPT